MSFKENLSKNSPLICTIIGAFGTIGAVVLSSWSMYKTKKKLDQKKEEGIDLTTKEVLKTALPYYIPTAAVTGLAVGTNIKSYQTNTKRTAAALTMYHLSKETLERYKARIAETLDEKEYAALEKSLEDEEIARKAHVDEGISFDKLNPNELWFVESFTGHVFRSTPEEIKDIESKLNHEFKAIDWLSVNDVLYYFDAKPCEAGELLGWNEGTKIEFGIDHDERNAVDITIGNMSIKAIKVYIRNYGYRYDSYGDFWHH